MKKAVEALRKSNTPPNHIEQKYFKQVSDR